MMTLAKLIIDIIFSFFFFKIQPINQSKKVKPSSRISFTIFVLKRITILKLRFKIHEKNILQDLSQTK